MASKPPRRTAARILEAALALFNRFGEPNVSTTLIASELGISAGNLYYHYPAKDELVNALYDRYERALAELLPAARAVQDVEDAWFFLHTLFELIWQYRFLYRDLNALLSRNRRLETRIQAVLAGQEEALAQMLAGLRRAGALQIDPDQLQPTATSMAVLLTWWLSHEYARDPRHALEPGSAQQAVLRGAHHVLHLLVPYLESGQRSHLLQLAGAYQDNGSKGG